MKNKSTLFMKLLLLATLIFSLSLSVNAAETTSKKAAFSMKTYTETFKGPKVTGTYSFKLPQLTGDSEVVKKINTSLASIYQDTLESKKSLEMYTKSETYQSGKFYFKTNCTTTYNKKGIVSFCFESKWFAGGVSNTWHYGATYSLKTGKKLALKNLVKSASTDSKVKKKVVTAFYEKLGSGYASKQQLNKSIKVKDLCYYLKGSKVIISSGAYGPCGMNGEVPIKLSSKY